MPPTSVPIAVRMGPATVARLGGAVARLRAPAQAAEAVAAVAAALEGVVGLALAQVAVAAAAAGAQHRVPEAAAGTPMLPAGGHRLGGHRLGTHQFQAVAVCRAAQAAPSCSFSAECCGRARQHVRCQQRGGGLPLSGDRTPARATW